MALRHVKKYFSQVASQYFQMTKMLEGFEQELKEGKVEESQVQLARNMISSLKDNYDRLAYIVYLFNLPNDPRSRKNKERDQLRLKNYFFRVKADGDSIEFENKDVLEHLKEFLKENGYYE